MIHSRYTVAIVLALVSLAAAADAPPRCHEASGDAAFHCLRRYARAACEPRHLPWRHAHDIVNYLALSFFDGVLNGNPDALARLDPERLATIDDLAWTSK